MANKSVNKITSYLFARRRNLQMLNKYLIQFQPLIPFIRFGSWKGFEQLDLEFNNVLRRNTQVYQRRSVQSYQTLGFQLQQSVQVVVTNFTSSFTLFRDIYISAFYYTNTHFRTQFTMVCFKCAIYMLLNIRVYQFNGSQSQSVLIF